MQSPTDILYLVGERVRKWGEWLQQTHKMWGDNLGEMCGLCSHRIYRELRKRKIDCMVCTNTKNNHAFVMVGNKQTGHIVDVTATQFEVQMPKVCVVLYSLRHKFLEAYNPTIPEVIAGKVKWISFLDMWDMHHYSANTTEVRLMFTDWLETQNPYKVFRKLKVAS